MSIGICLGIGIIIATKMENISLGMSIGMFIGMIIGLMYKHK